MQGPLINIKKHQDFKQGHSIISVDQQIFTTFILI